MTEALHGVDEKQFEALKTELKAKLGTDRDVLDFFGLPQSRVNEWIDNSVFDDHEIRMSPGYMSAGWGHNQSTRPVIAQTDISDSVNNYLHESRHGFHNLVCQTLFEGKDAVKNFKLFKKNVLEDPGFVKQIDRPGGSNLQERMLNAAWAIAAKANPSAEQIKDVAWMLGALTYQHAYYVDPGMCEAAASFHDTGFVWVTGEVNQWFSKLLIPGEQFLEGYNNTDWQIAFKIADAKHKALLIKKTDYDRHKYFEF